MSDTQTIEAYGTLGDQETLTIRRRLPGPVERVWAYLTNSDLRRRWLAAGEMEQRVGAPFELVWRNDELTKPPGVRPEGFKAEQRMASKITEIEPMRRLSFTWDGSGDVTFDLAPAGKDVILTVTHRRLPNRGTKLSVSAGWHTHLEILADMAAGRAPSSPFWDRWQELRAEYESRIPA